MYDSTLKLIATARQRRPSPRLSHRLDSLFRCLADEIQPEVARDATDRIWELWMHYPDAHARDDLERAVRALVALDFPVAQSVLDGLVRRHPDYAEAWNKRATLYYMLQRDAECIANLEHALRLEPRHFGAVCGFAEICLSQGARDVALFAFNSALALNPHLEAAREAVERLTAERPGGGH